MSTSSSRPSTPQPISPQRQQWEAAVLASRFPRKTASLIMNALLAPGPAAAYTIRPWEPLERFDAPAIHNARRQRVRRLLRVELRQARSLVWTPLGDLCRLERSAPLALHAARLEQLYAELARRPGGRADDEVRQALTSPGMARGRAYTRGTASA